MLPNYLLLFIADSRCAFAAWNSGPTLTKIINDSPIVYDDVEFNVCNAYRHHRYMSSVGRD